MDPAVANSYRRQKGEGDAGYRERRHSQELKAQKRNVAREMHSSIDAATSGPALLHRLAERSPAQREPRPAEGERVYLTRLITTAVMSSC